MKIRQQNKILKTKLRRENYAIITLKKKKNAKFKTWVNKKQRRNFSSHLWRVIFYNILLK